MTLQTSHRYVRRLLRALTDGQEVYVVRIDPDARVARRFRSLAAFSSVFGTLETISEGRQDEISVPANVQGGCIGMTRDAAVRMLRSGILNHRTCATGFLTTWARCEDMRRVAARGSCSDDFIISWAAHRLGIPIVESSEIRSRWRRPVDNRELKYAVTHPHKVGADMANQASLR